MKLPVGTKKVLLDIETGDVEFIAEELKVGEPVERTRVKIRTPYWYFDKYGVSSFIDVRDEEDDANFSFGNYFHTKEQAEQAHLIVKQFLLSWNGK